MKITIGTVDYKEIGKLWDAVNALGGMGGRENNEYDTGYNRAIDAVLLEIEERFEHVLVVGRDDTDRCGLCGQHIHHDIHTRLKPE